MMKRMTTRKQPLLTTLPRTTSCTSISGTKHPLVTPPQLTDPGVTLPGPLISSKPLSKRRCMSI
jgi:hypothetical protein